MRIVSNGLGNSSKGKWEGHHAPLNTKRDGNPRFRFDTNQTCLMYKAWQKKALPTG